MMNKREMDEFCTVAKTFYEGLREGGVLRETAKTLYGFKQDLEQAGFSSEEAMQIISNQGLGVKQT